MNRCWRTADTVPTHLVMDSMKTHTALDDLKDVATAGAAMCAVWIGTPSGLWMQQRPEGKGVWQSKSTWLDPHNMTVRPRAVALRGWGQLRSARTAQQNAVVRNRSLTHFRLSP